MIKNYIFDFGNVLTLFDGEEMTERILGKQYVADIAPVVFDRLYWDRLDNGTITDSEVKAEFAKRLDGELYGKACAVYDTWVDNLTPIAGMTELVRDIKKAGGKLYILSNISTGFAESYKRNPWVCELFSLFDGLMFSAVEGLCKPGQEIFRHILTKYGLSARESLFIDDSKKNIDGAKGAGICTYLFDGNAQRLRKFIFG